MRKAILFMLLAATATAPLAAQAWGGPGPGPERADRGDWRGPPGPGPRGEALDRVDRRRDWRGPAGDVRPPDGPRADGRPDRGPDWRASPGDPRRPDRDYADRRGDWRGPPGDFRGGDRPGGWDRGRPDYRWSENRRGGWDARWRDDRRYDWQGYRAGNRAIYRAPRYYGPRGDRYVRWSPGYRVEPFFYGRNYWISDPWRYRLPPAYGSYQWVRYYDDVALIDLRSGLIEDILYGFFWR